MTLKEKAEIVVISTTRLTEVHFALVTQTCHDAGLNCRRMRIALE